MNTQTILKRFWWQQFRFCAAALVMSLASAMVLTWLTTMHLDAHARLHAFFLAFAVPLTAAPPVMIYIIRQNIRNLRLYQQTRRYANTDDLTGLLNRRSFTEHGTARMADAEQTNSPTALLLVDIDWFKRVNDSHGHEAGDEVLCHVARTLQYTAPADALVARLGGEEFTILCRADTPDDLYRIAESLRQAVESARFLYKGDVIKVTISLGLTLAHPGDTLSAILSRADKALYDAKNHGRNQSALAA